MASTPPIDSSQEERLTLGPVTRDDGGGTFIIDGNIVQARPKGWKGSRARRVLTQQPLDFLPDTAIGLKLPFNDDNGRLFGLNYLSMDQTMDNLKNLLLTRKGERVMHPKFGTRLQEALFEPNNEKLHSYVHTEVEKAITYWLPYILLQDVKVGIPTTPGSSNSFLDPMHGIQVTVSFSLKNNRIDTRTIVLEIKAD